MPLPTWTWPEWRRAPAGLRVRHARSGELGTYLGPARNKHNGAKVRWDRVAGFASRAHDWAYVVAPARDLEPVRVKAWDLIGFDSDPDTVGEELQRSIGEGPVSIRVKDGRALYEAVLYNDATSRSNNVKLARLEARPDGIRQVSRYVDPDTEIEFIAQLR